MRKISLLVTDDHTLVRQSWVMWFNSDSRFEVVGECGTGEEAIEIAKTTRPDVVLMDISLNGMNGFEATAQIRKYSPGSKILAVSAFTQPVYVRQMMKAGAMGYITKNSTPEEMFNGIIEVHNNRKFICEEIKDILVNRVASSDGNPSKGIYSLSTSELRIIDQLKKGLTSKEIAVQSNLSAKTVDAHRYNILKKLNLPNVASLVNFINNSELAMSV